MARVANDIGTQQKALASAETSEAAIVKREAEKLRRARESEQRKEAQERKADEHRRQQERLADERRRQADLALTAARIGSTENRFAATIAELRQPKAEQLRIPYAAASADPKKPLRVDQEMRRVKAAVKASTHRDLVSVE